MRDDTRQWIDSDKNHAWHPFTPQDGWTAPDNEPLVIARGEGPWLWDSEGRRYLDGNSSIWTNIHGHAHPVINRAISDQLARISHSSYLGLANPRASELAEKLSGFFPENTLDRVFFSDNGSTAIEVAMKMALQYRMQIGEQERSRFVAFSDAYHGDTLGAASLGGVSRFFERFRHLGPEVTFVSDLVELEKLDATSINAVVIEPLIQGVNEIRPWPKGMLHNLRIWCDKHGILLILDEVMTGFGRTGTMFACQQEEVIPDFLCLAKGLTGGYMPLAATLTTSSIYDAFRGDPSNAFYYGHSYTANQLGCAAALASLELFDQEQVMQNLPPKVALLSELLNELSSIFPEVKETRQCGLIAGIELDSGLGPRVCMLARKHGLLTRPIRDTIVFMPPLCILGDEIQYGVAALESALKESRTSA